LERGVGERLEEISWTDRVRNGEVVQTIEERRNILHTVKRRKTNCICQMLRGNCLYNTLSDGR